MKKIQRRVMAFLIVAALGFVLASCGGSGGGTGGSGTLSNPPTGYKFTDTNGDTITSWSGTTTVQLRDANDNIVLSFTPDGDVDFSNVIASRTSLNTIVHFPAAADKAGITGTVTMNVPCPLSNINQVLLCPGISDVADLGPACTDVTLLNANAPTANNYTFANATTRTSTTDCQVSADIDDFGTGGVSDIVLPTLTAEDQNTITPCPDQDLLDDPIFWQTLSSLDATVDPFRMWYDPTDTASICAMGSDFTASQAANVDIFFIGDHLNGLISGGATGIGLGAGVCGDDPNTNSFPKAGVYRRDFQVQDGTNTYLYRIRATVAGDASVVGQPIATVLGSEDLASNLKFYDPSGSEIPYTSAVQQIAAGFLPYPINEFTVKKTDGTELFTVQVEMICAKQL